MASRIRTRQHKAAPGMAGVHAGLHSDRHDAVASGRDHGRPAWDHTVLDTLAAIANRPRLLLVATGVLVAAAGVAFALIEGKDILTGLWWADVTGLTIGYGDHFPVTLSGRLVGTFLIVAMLFLALCLGAQITSRLIEDQDEFTHGEQEQVKALLARMVEGQDRLLARLETHDKATRGDGPVSHDEGGS